MTGRHWSAGYVGISYERRGRTREGVDCWGISRLPLIELKGLDVPSYLDVPCAPDELAEQAAAMADIAGDRPWVRVQRPREFDIAMFRHSGLERHTGIVAGDGLMLHIVEGGLSCIARFRDVHWRSRLIGFYRHEGLLDEVRA